MWLNWSPRKGKVVIDTGPADLSGHLSVITNIEDIKGMIENSNIARDFPETESVPTRLSPSWSERALDDSRHAEPYENLQDLLAVLKKRWKLIAGCVIVLGVLAFLLGLMITPQYSGLALLEVNRDSGGGTLDSGTAVDDVKTEVETDTNILQSDAIALKVIEDLKLGDVKPFNKIRVPAEQGLSLDKAPKTRDAYLHLFAKQLKISSIVDSRLIQVSFRNPDPVIAANVANAVVDTFITDTTERRLSTTSSTSYWISKEIEGLRDRVRNSEQALANFEHKAGLAGVDVQPIASGSVAMSGHNPVLDRLTTLNQEKTQTEANRISSEMIYKLTQSQNPEVVMGLGSMNIIGGGSVLATGGGLDILRSLRSQEIALKTQYADMATKFGAKNPRLVEVKTQIDALDAEIRAEIERIQQRAQNDLHYAQQNEAAVDDALAKQQTLANKYTDDTVQLQLLAQEAFSNRALYQNLFSELSQARVATGIHATRLDLVSRALPAGGPSYPNKLLLIAGALAAGLFFGIVGAFVLQSMDHTIRVAKDAESTAFVPVLAELPSSRESMSGAGRTPLISAPRSNFSEAFHFLCTAAASMLDANVRSRALLVASPLAGDGKSAVAYNLAVAIAQRGERVLLIDADLREPSLHTAFGAGLQPGLSEVLRGGDRSLFAQSTVTHGGLSNLSLLPAGARPDLPAELFSSPAFDRLLDEARSHYRWIVIDSSPAVPYTDATIIAGKADGVLGVIRAGVTSRNVLTVFTKLLARANAPLLGLVLNGVSEDARRSMDAIHEQKMQKVAKHA